MSYTFLPWLREGVASDVADVAGGSGSATLQLLVNRAPIDPLPVRLLGPGDVLGIDARQIVRTDPAASARAVEPNYFPLVEFDQPSFPWLFSPGGPDSANRLRPWLVLVVVPKQPGVTINPDPVSKVPVLTIERPAIPGDELPDLAESWAWAHVQVTGPAVGPDLARVLAEEPARSVSRLVCPRRLHAATAYVACVVPAFSAGRAAGLGEPVGAEPFADAWAPGVEPVRLPVYYLWEFSTGESGDFEALAALLTSIDKAPEKVGRRTLDLSKPGFAVPTGASTVEMFDGALQPPGQHPSPIPEWFMTRMTELFADTNERSVRPPLYGGIQIRETGLRGDNNWLDELNTDPRRRAAAGLGARFVREQQERLIGAAWAQVGQLDAANRFLARSQLSQAIGESVWRNRMTPLAEQDPSALLQLIAPARLAGGSLRARALTTALPDAVLAATYRRLTRPRGPIARRASPAVDQPAVALMSGVLNPQTMLTELRPNEAHRARVAAQLVAPEEMGRPWWSDPTAQVVYPPVFPAPLATELQRLSADHLLPGAEHIPPDTVLVLEPNRPFIAAFLAGANHEMSRELLWREFPTELTATYFHVFWDRRGQAGPTADPEDLADIPPIADWYGPLGEPVRVAPKGELVLVIRGELLRRYPRAVVYAVRAARAGSERVLADETVENNRKLPLFTGYIEPDISFFGLPLSVVEARGDTDGLGWFFVFQEQPTEPRFGLDEVTEEQFTDPPAQAIEFRGLGWGHLVTKDEFSSLTHVPVEHARPATWKFTDRPKVSWTGGSADLAVLTLQRPARVAIHGMRLLGETS